MRQRHTQRIQKPCKRRDGSASLRPNSKANLPAISIVCVRSTPPDIRVIFLCISRIDAVAFLGQRAAHKLYPSELVDATGQQHAIVVQVSALLTACLQKERGVSEGTEAQGLQPQLDQSNCSHSRENGHGQTHSEPTPGGKGSLLSE